MPPKIPARAFKWGCSFIFSARRGRRRRMGGVLRMRGEFHHGEICGIRLCAACASNAHNENRGHNTGEAGFARHFRFSSMAKYSFRKKMLAPRLARDCDYARAMECGSCASRVHMRRPEGFLRRRLRYLRDSGLENALQISPPPLQRSFNRVIIPLQNLRFAVARLYFTRTDALGVHIELWARSVPSPEKLRAPKKSDFPPKTKCGLPPPESALLGFRQILKFPAAGAPDFAGRGREPEMGWRQSRLSSARLPPPCFEGEDISILSSEPGLTSFPASMSASVIFAIRISCFLYPPREWS